MKKHNLLIGVSAAILVALVAAVAFFAPRRGSVPRADESEVEPITVPVPPLPDTAPAADASGMKRISMPLTVLTYNTHLFAGSNAVPARKVEQKFRPGEPEVVFEDSMRAELIARKLETSGADIIALQELWACGRPAWFADRLHSTYAYSRSYTAQCPPEVSFKALDAEMREAGKDAAVKYCLNHWLVVCAPIVYHWIARDYEKWAAQLPGVMAAGFNVLKNHKLMNGLLLLSKFPIDTVEFHEYTAGPTQLGADSLAHKGTLTATIRLPNGAPLRVGITHANTGVGGGRDAKYWTDIAEFTRWTLLGVGTGPAILMGDLNVPDRDANVSGAAVKYEQLTNIFAGAGAVDADRQVNQGNSKTINGAGNALIRYFLPKDTVQLAGIDYVFYRPGESGVILKAEAARAITDWKYSAQMRGKTTEVDLSDHYPLLVRFSLWTAPQPIM